MHVSIRTYRVGTGSINDAPRRPRLCRRHNSGARLHRIPGRPDQERTVASITHFREADQAEASNELAAQWIAQELQEFKIESMGRFGAEVMVSRAIAEMLEPAHR